MMDKEIKKQYLRAMLPAFLGSVGMGIYYFTDGLFIGNALGNDGMSAISISWVIVTFLTAVATGIGMGGSIRYSVAMGRKDGDAAKDCFFTTVLLLLLSSVVLTVGLVWCVDDILRFLGASGRVLTLSREYSALVVYGTVFQIVGIGALPLVRNMGGNILASVSMGLGYLLNFTLDYVLMFLFPLGMVGCSIAYLSGQIVVAVPCVCFLLKRYQNEYRGRRIGKHSFLKAARKIAFSGLSPFGLYFSQNVVSLLLNKAFLTGGGSEALACYTVVIYVGGITNTLHRAIMDGSQPLMSRLFGAGDQRGVRSVAKLMYGFSFALITVGATATVALKHSIASLFGVSTAVSAEVAMRLPLYILAYAFICFSRTTLTYLYAVEQNRKAAMLTYAEPILYAVLLEMFSAVWGINGIWIAILAVYFTMSLLAALFLLRRKGDCL